MGNIERSSCNIDYYGIISVLIDEIGIKEIIDARIKKYHNQKVSTGQSVKVILLNMLAIFMRPLYLTSEFLNDKPVDRLINANLTASDFTDNVLGAALDRLYDNGLEELFMAISSKMFLNYPEYVSAYLHADTTTMTVFGQYNTKYDENAIELAYGYSKNHRNDLKQFIISMVTSNTLPLFLTTLSGNTSDATHFRDLMKQYGNQMQDAFDSDQTFIFDSKFYCFDTIEACSNDIIWISRVPETISSAVELIQKAETVKMVDTSMEGYRIYATSSDYGGIEQKWVLVSSEKAAERESKTLDRKIIKNKEQVDKDVWHLGNKEFKTKQEACDEAKKVVKSWKYHEVIGNLEDRKTMDYEIIKKKVNGKKGRAKKNEKKYSIYKIKLKVRQSKIAVKQAYLKMGCFVLASNNLELSAEEILRAYKSQHNVERGFRFLKDPMFFVDGVYLKNQNRIMAMAMIMGLALMVYSLAELKLRSAFEIHKEVFLDQYRKPNRKPTFRRVLQTWSGIHVWYIKIEGEIVEEAVINLRPENMQVLRLLGQSYEQIYSDKKKDGKL
ncbi:MAG: IS1634 family transposase, partial [Candidatus Heimdallarchaeota archaeon]